MTLHEVMELEDSLWLVGEMAIEMPVRVGDIVHQLAMPWAEGMLGVMPVFKTEGQAHAYAALKNSRDDGCREVWAVELVKDMRKKP